MTAATATTQVRELLAHLTGEGPQRTAITGLTTPLGETITATVSERPASAPGHLDARLTVADMHRGDDDTDLAILIEPSAVVGIPSSAPEAWNVHMTLPTLLRILGAENPMEGTHQ